MAVAILYVMAHALCARSGLILPIDLNLPIVGVAAILVILFLKLNTPAGSLRSKVARMDWM